MIDFIDNLTGDDGSEWLVFIQISLKSYVKHRKLDMFQCNSRNDENKSWLLYTKYRHKYNVQFTDHKKKVLLVYISPNQDKLEELQASV